MGLLLGYPAKASNHSLSFRKSFSHWDSVHCAENLEQEKSVINVHASVVSEPKYVKSLPSENASSPFSVDFPSSESASARVPPSTLLDTQ